MGEVYFALVPDYSSGGSSRAPSRQIGSYLNTSFVSGSAFGERLKQVTGKDPVVVQNPSSMRYDSSGNAVFTGTLTDAYYNEMKTFYAANAANFGSSSTDGVPMCVVMTNFGDPKYISGGAVEWVGEAAKAELTASPNPIILAVGAGQSISVNLINTVTGTTATKVKATIDIGDCYIATPGAGEITGINSTGGTVTTSGSFTLVSDCTAATTGALTITYEDSKAGVQTPLNIPVQILNAGAFKA